VRRGEGGGLYLATTGVGVRLPGVRPSLGKIRDGDVVLVSGPVGDHGTAVMLAREEFGLRGDLVSDAGPVMALTEPLLALDGLRFMRDPTRGGIASIGHEILKATGLGVRFEASIPVREPVKSVCDMLGYDPYYLACEGRVVAILAPDHADDALALWRGLPEGRDAARIGRITAAEQRVILETPLGGERFLEELEDDPLPRIC
jgi:hydrogenase expression/formation protein HypE